MWNVSFEVPKGEIVSIIGANGSGKSTLLNSIAGLLAPSRGTIEFFGERAWPFRIFRIEACFPFWNDIQVWVFLRTLMYLFVIGCKVCWWSSMATVMYFPLFWLILLISLVLLYFPLKCFQYNHQLPLRLRPFCFLKIAKLSL